MIHIQSLYTAWLLCASEIPCSGNFTAENPTTILYDPTYQWIFLFFRICSSRIEAHKKLMYMYGVLLVYVYIAKIAHGKKLSISHSSFSFIAFLCIYPFHIVLSFRTLTPKQCSIDAQPSSWLLGIYTHTYKTIYYISIHSMHAMTGHRRVRPSDRSCVIRFWCGVSLL